MEMFALRSKVHTAKFYRNMYEILRYPSHNINRCCRKKLQTSYNIIIIEVN
jgi:hypothetical protein